MAGPFHTIAADGLERTLDPRVGHLRTHAVREGSPVPTALHTASWIDEPAITDVIGWLDELVSPNADGGRFAAALDITFSDRT